MKRFIEGENRSQATLFPERLDEYIAEDNAIRVVDAFVNKLDLQDLEFSRADVAHGTADAGLQDDCRFQERQPPGHPACMYGVCRRVPGA